MMDNYWYLAVPNHNGKLDGFDPIEGKDEPTYVYQPHVYTLRYEDLPEICGRLFCILERTPSLSLAKDITICVKFKAVENGFGHNGMIKIGWTFISGCRDQVLRVQGVDIDSLEEGLKICNRTVLDTVDSDDVFVYYAIGM